jgi:hypothetical protein
MSNTFLSRLLTARLRRAARTTDSVEITARVEVLSYLHHPYLSLTLKRRANVVESRPIED